MDSDQVDNEIGLGITLLVGGIVSITEGKCVEIILGVLITSIIVDVRLFFILIKGFIVGE